jgi:hypothetical protein
MYGNGLSLVRWNHFDNVGLFMMHITIKTYFTEGTEANFDAKVNEWQWGEFFGRHMIMDLNN